MTEGQASAAEFAGAAGRAEGAGKWTVLAHIQATNGVTTDEVAWVITAYLITLVVIMPLTARLSSVLGRRRFYLLSVGIFTVASDLCGLSRSLGQLIVFRTIQGLGAARSSPSPRRSCGRPCPARSRPRPWDSSEGSSL